MEVTYLNGKILQNGEEVPFVRYHDLFKNNTLREIRFNLLFDESEDEHIDNILFIMSQLKYHCNLYENRYEVVVSITLSDRGGSIIKNEALFHAISDFNRCKKNNVRVFITNHILVSACVIFAEFAPNLKELKIHVPYKDMDDALQCGIFLDDHLEFIRRYLNNLFCAELLNGYARLKARCLREKGRLDPCVWESIYYEDD